MTGSELFQRSLIVDGFLIQLTKELIRLPGWIALLFIDESSETN